MKLYDLLNILHDDNKFYLCDASTGRVIEGTSWETKDTIDERWFDYQVETFCAAIDEHKCVSVYFDLKMPRW